MGGKQTSLKLPKCFTPFLLDHPNVKVILKTRRERRVLNACLQEDYSNPEQQELDNEKQDFLWLKEAARCWMSQNEDEADFPGGQSSSVHLKPDPLFCRGGGGSLER